MADIPIEVQVDQDQQLIEQEQEQDGQCPHCEEPIEEGQPQSELRCHHRYHTACFFQAINAFPHDGMNQNQCRVCQEPFAEIEEEEDTYMNRQIQRIRNQWDTNVNFRKDIKKYIKLQRVSDKAQRGLKQFALQKKTERNDLLLALKQQLEAVYHLVKDDILSSDTYKESRKAESKAIKSHKQLIQNYHLQDSRWMLRRALEGKPGLKRWPKAHRRYFGGNLRCMLRRMFHFRIKW